MKLLDQYDLKKKIITYVKDEGANLNAMTIILKSMVDCEVLDMEESSKVVALAIYFMKHANMGQQFYFFAKT